MSINLEKIAEDAFRDELEKTALSTHLLRRVYKKAYIEQMTNLLPEKLKKDPWTIKDISKDAYKYLPKYLEMGQEVFPERSKKDLLKGLVKATLKARKI